MRVLSRGTTGKDVENLQYTLNILVDGHFGRGTESAVKDFQKSNNLLVDGYVGPNTQKTLGLSDFRVHIYDKDRVWFAGTPYSADYKPLRSLASWADKEKADYVYNLAFFNMSGTGNDKYGVIKGRTVTYLKAEGVDIGYGGVKDRLTIDSQNICGGYKTAIRGGAKKYLPSWGYRCRNANGLLTNGKYFQVQSVTTATETQIRDHMHKNYDVDLMLIQDSGGSTGFYDAKKEIHLAGEMEGVHGRPVASVVCVRNEEPIPDPEPDPEPTPSKTLVCLDAGHGSDTAGKRSFDGTLLEYEFNRDVVSRIADILQSEGVDVLLTAPTDSDVLLQDRVNIANQSGATVVVSVHANAYGTEWNSATGWKIFHNIGSTKGLALAKAIQKQSIPFLGLVDRGIEGSSFYMVKFTDAPAVLIEHGFYTNIQEVELLKTDNYREKCAIADAKGILDYLGVAHNIGVRDYKKMYLNLKSKVSEVKELLKND